MNIMEVNGKGSRTETGEQSFEAIERALKRAAPVLRRGGVSFLLGGSLASWARGGPESHHDLDLYIRPEHAEQALELLTGEGMEPERPPEEWLYKAWDGNVLVDLIFHTKGVEIDDAMFERAETLDVSAMSLRVLALEDLLQTKLAAMDEHSADFGAVLRIGRALREQIDWEELGRRAQGSPFAEAYLVLVSGLGITQLQR